MNRKEVVIVIDKVRDVYNCVMAEHFAKGKGIKEFHNKLKKRVLKELKKDGVLK